MLGPLSRLLYAPAGRRARPASAISSRGPRVVPAACRASSRTGSRRRSLRPAGAALARAARSQRRPDRRSSAPSRSRRRARRRRRSSRSTDGCEARVDHRPARHRLPRRRRALRVPLAGAPRAASPASNGHPRLHPRLRDRPCRASLRRRAGRLELRAAACGSSPARTSRPADRARRRRRRALQRWRVADAARARPRRAPRGRAPARSCSAPTTAALGVVRSLGRRGIPRLGARATATTPSRARSRYARRRAAGRDGPGTHSSRTCSRSRTTGLDGWALVPDERRDAALVARHHDALGRAVRADDAAVGVAAVRLRQAPDVSARRRARHRRSADLRPARPAAEAGAPLAPRTRCPQAGGQARSTTALTAAKAWRVDDAATLRARYDEACRARRPGGRSWSRSSIPGGGEAQFSYAALCADGAPLAALARAAHAPVPAGLRAREHVRRDRSTARRSPSRAERLLARARLDRASSRSSSSATRATAATSCSTSTRASGAGTRSARAPGVDFPYLSWRLARGEAVPRGTARPGVRWVRLYDRPADVAARDRSRGGMSAAAVPALAARAARERAIFARDDPLPGLVELPLLVSPSSEAAPGDAV